MCSPEVQRGTHDPTYAAVTTAPVNAVAVAAAHLMQAMSANTSDRSESPAETHTLAVSPAPNFVASTICWVNVCHISGVTFKSYRPGW